MNDRRRIGKKTLKSVIKYGALGTVGAQLTAIAAVTAVDEHRKRRNPQSGKFPASPPLEVQISDCRVTIYTDGMRLYDSMLETIERAQEYIYFETFIIKADPVGFAFREALIRAAERGVKVFIIQDSWGNLNQPPTISTYPPHPCIQVINFPLIRPGILTGQARQKGRDHRKILAADGKVGYVGGYNIGKLYAQHWRDTHIKITGPQVWELENAFVDMWNLYHSEKQTPLLDRNSPDWNPDLRAIVNTPAFNSHPVRASYLESIDRAAKRLWITMGYFIPDQGLRLALIQAAQRGVDVRILIPEYSNHIVADWVGKPHYSELLEHGVRIFLYHDAMIHAKTMTADGIWSTVGTTNIDRLSMAGNFEINMNIFSSDMATAMEEIFRRDLTNASELTQEIWEERSNWARLAERVLRPLGPLL